MGSSEWWWWGAASIAQITAAMVSIRRGSSRITAASMPFRAFGIATLFVSGGATAAISLFHASGLRQLEDWNRIGTGIRRSLGAPPRRNTSVSATSDSTIEITTTS
ncbi:hypothetical protein ZOSMA_56G01150 [Zostera marina]|uniref:Uncharacterized protein n=1 Tax=Zostera marina TaxID=29655 RepID=A0A0K9NVU5_ZOSMR|nr:hypothetical protein ZOSMA_56G01150 [Zostera marina]